MSPLLSTLANASALGYRSLVAGAATSFESIATVSVGSGGASSIDFTSIPGTYKHLQLRYIARNATAAYFVRLQFNSNTTASNYSYHILNGTGAAVTVGAGANEGYNYAPRQSTATSTFGVGVVDILDYADTNKNTTIRGLGGYDNNGSGDIDFLSGAFYQTAAITSIQISVAGGSYQQYSHFALYGIKGA